MDIYRIQKMFAFLAVFSAFVLAMTPCITMAGGGPEPGPDDGGTYSYEPPPFSGDATLELRYSEIEVAYNLILVDGTLNQLGNSGCYIPVGGTNEYPEIGFLGNIEEDQIPSCNNLHPNDLIGFTATVPYNQILGCDIVGPIFIEIIATAKLLCQAGENGLPEQATAKLIVMQYVSKQ